MSPSPATGVQAAFDDGSRKNRAWYAVLGAMGLVAAIVAILFGTGVLKLGGQTPSPSLQAATGGPKPSLSLPAQSAPPVTQRVEDRAIMPDDVRAYLLHIEKVEAQKVELTLRQQAEMMKFGQMASVLGAAMGAMNPYDMSEGDIQAPDKVTVGKFEDMKPDWEALIAFMASVVPPEECRALGDDYYRALGQIPAMTSDVVDVLNSVAQDPSQALEKASKLKSRSYNEIDRYFLRADQRLAEICRKYEERKWFNIKADVVAGGSLGQTGAGF